MFSGFKDEVTAVVVGSGAIASGLIDALAQEDKVAKIFVLSRKPLDSLPNNAFYHFCDITDEQSIETAVKIFELVKPIHMLFIATGVLHTDDFMPEKSLRCLDAGVMQKVFAVNTTGPALLVKHFVPLMDKSTKSTMVALSARVGSISDNRLGGWYSYRASKAALNMFIKTASIELARTHPRLALFGYHPGTVDSNLSKPFQKGVPEGKLFTAEKTVGHLCELVENLSAEDTGKCFAWDGKEIMP